MKTSPDIKDLEALLLDGPVPLRPFFEKLPQGLIISNQAGEIIFYNQAQARTDGLSPEEVLGRKLGEVFISASWPLAGQDSAPAAVSYTTAKGRNVRALITVTPLFSDILQPETQLKRPADRRRRPLPEPGKPCGAIFLVREAAEETPPALKPEAGRRSGEKDGFAKLIGQSGKFQKALKLGRAGALSPSPVLLAGETGTGKEMFARSIHEHSPRSGRPFVAINCSAIPQDLLEGLLFGTSKGAFTGAADKAGLFEEADKGTLFLDELDSMPLKLQPKLLRVLQERKIRRVGSHREVDLDVKIISSVSDSPEKAIQKGKLRPDLFYRLGVMVVQLPPLRERLDDLPLLTEYFISKHNAILGKKIEKASPEVLEAFKVYNWPGNVRELEHIVEAIVNLAEREAEINLEMLPDHFSLLSRITLGQTEAKSIDRLQELLRQAEADEAPIPPVSLKDREKAMIANALAITGGNVAKAARLLDISRQLLVYKMKKHRLTRDSFK